MGLVTLERNVETQRLALAQMDRCSHILARNVGIITMPVNFQCWRFSSLLILRGNEGRLIRRFDLDLVLAGFEIFYLKTSVCRRGLVEMHIEDASGNILPHAG